MSNTFLANAFTSTVTSSNPIIGIIIYRLGLIACISAGYSKGKKYCHFPILYCILNSFGGGITRDSFILGTDIWFLSIAARPDILFVLCGCFIYTIILGSIRNNNTKVAITYVMNVLDACTVGSFVAIGLDKAVDMGFSISSAIISGYVTACWGGVTANFKHPAANITISSKYYHFVILLGSIMYFFHRNSFALCIFIPITLLMGNINYGALITSSYFEIIYTFSKIGINERIHSLRAFFSGSTARATDYFFPNRRASYPRVYLAFHRLRIC